ncbi:MAG: hypothetical protein HKP11_11695, partial [Flavobacteriaceae bacterium]|nr:hypothetical protein [Flavobacteriaceae bacterium]
QDTPWFLLYHQLYELYPNARFILTEREEKAWLKSVQGHFGRDAYPYHAYIYGTVDSIANGDVYLKKYREHNAAVRNYFYDKPGQLLIIDLPNLRQPWSVISEFLDVKRPKFSFPHANKEDSRGKLTTRLKKLLKKYYYSS